MPLKGLYAITCPANNLGHRVTQAIQGGASIIQYRDKSQDHQKRLREATEIKRICHTLGALFIVNDDISLAVKSEADGVHLGKTDHTLNAARQLLGNQAIIGISCYDDLQRAQQAEKAGANYVAFGRFFPSQSKPDASPAPMTLLQHAKEQLSIPIVAIGGITPDNGAQLITAGADMLAAIHSIFSHNDVQNAAKKIALLF